MSMRPVAIAAVAVLSLYAGPVQAQALVTPFVGSAFHGDTIEPPKPSSGVAIGFWGYSPIGIEGEIAIFPGFFPPQHPDADHHVVGDMTTVMVNALVGAPFGGTMGPGFRPYMSVGAGLFRIQAAEPNGRFEVDPNAFGVSLGGGAIVFFTTRLGVRGDLRYVREFQQPVNGQEDPGCCHTNQIAFRQFHFGRGVVGLVVRF
jgi:hypothetical protein